MSAEPVYTVAQVAQMLRLTEGTVALHCRTGLVPGAFRTGPKRGQWRIPESAIEAYKNRHRAPVPDDPYRIQPRRPQAQRLHNRRRRAA